MKNAVKFVILMVVGVLLVVDLIVIFRPVTKMQAAQPEQRVYLYEQADYAMQRGGMPVPAGAKIVGFTCLPHGEDVTCYTAFTK